MADNLGELWKKGTTAPLASDIEEGGLAIDVAGKIAYSKGSDGNVFPIGGNLSHGLSDWSGVGLSDSDLVGLDRTGALYLILGALRLEQAIGLQAYSSTTPELVRIFPEIVNHNTIIRKTYSTELSFELESYSSTKTARMKFSQISATSFNEIPYYEIANKDYVDSENAVQDTLIVGLEEDKVSKTGDIMTGGLTLNTAGIGVSVSGRYVAYTEGIIITMTGAPLDNMMVRLKIVMNGYSSQITAPEIDIQGYYYAGTGDPQVPYILSTAARASGIILDEVYFYEDAVSHQPCIWIGSVDGFGYSQTASVELVSGSKESTIVSIVAGPKPTDGIRGNLAKIMHTILDDGTVPFSGEALKVWTNVKVGDGVDGNSIAIRGTTADQNAYLRLKRPDNSDLAWFYANDAEDHVSLKLLDDTGTLHTDFAFLRDGNISGGALAPTDAGHLTRKDYVDNRSYSKSQHIDSSAGLGDAAKPIVLNAQGQIDPSMLDTSTFYYVSPFTPVSGAEYPSIIDETPGAFWVCEVDYAFVDAGDLQGKDITIGDFMVWGAAGWSIMAGEMNPTLYYMLDGSQALTDPFQAGGQKLINIAPGTVDGDAVDFTQLATKADKTYVDSEIDTHLHSEYSLISDAWKLKPKTIGSSTVEMDLNTIVDVGHYISSSGSNLWLNLPVGSHPAFTLFVESIQPGSSSEYWRQTLSEYTNTDKWTRIHASAASEWGEWVKMAIDDGISYLPLAGGIMAGAMSSTYATPLVLKNDGNTGVVFQDALGASKSTVYGMTDHSLKFRVFSEDSTSSVDFNLLKDGNIQIPGVAPTSDTHAVRKDYVDTGFVSKDGGTVTGQLTVMQELTVHDDLLLTGGEHRITANDGNANFAIRAGNQSVDGIEEYTVAAQGAGILALNHELDNPNFELKISTGVTEEVAGEPVVWGKALSGDGQGFLKWGGNEIIDKGNSVTKSTGPADGDKGIRLTSEGYIDVSMLQTSTFTPVGPYDPSDTTNPTGEYPDVTEAPYGAFWYVDNLVNPVGEMPDGDPYYEFVTDPVSRQDVTTETLLGRKITTGDFMIWSTSGWGIMSGEINPDLYMELSKTSHFQDNGNPLVINGKISYLHPSTADGEAVAHEQLVAHQANRNNPHGITIEQLNMDTGHIVLDQWNDAVYTTDSQAWHDDSFDTQDFHMHWVRIGNTIQLAGRFIARSFSSRMDNTDLGVYLYTDMAKFLRDNGIFNELWWGTGSGSIEASGPGFDTPVLNCSVHTAGGILKIIASDTFAVREGSSNLACDSMTIRFTLMASGVAPEPLDFKP